MRCLHFLPLPLPRHKCYYAINANFERNRYCMKSCSHYSLGHYLNKTYLQRYPVLYQRAFSIGCIQPDKNPTTYFKGSIRWQWLRGHNWNNAKRYIRRSANRLQGKIYLKMWDFYCLGKLIHYTADAFTYTHNAHYSKSLSAHRDYESILHRKLEMYLKERSDGIAIICDPNKPVGDYISKNHKQYIHRHPCMDNDMEYSVRMCSQVLQLILHSKSITAVNID